MSHRSMVFTMLLLSVLASSMLVGTAGSLLA